MRSHKDVDTLTCFISSFVRSIGLPYQMFEAVEMKSAPICIV